MKLDFKNEVSEDAKQIMAKLFMVTLFVVATCLASCKKENASSFLPSDHERTIECSIGLEECNLLFMNCVCDDLVETMTVDVHVKLLWTPPDNFSMAISGYFHEPDVWITDLPKHGYGTFTSSIICNVGKVKGLGEITEIPNSDCFDDKLRSNAGYGYVIRFPNPLISDYYVRMYVVGPIYNTSKEVIGVKVKYQYPFEPFKP
jgi:hypothetical protein